MSKQFRMFDQETTGWVERVWSKLEPEKHREIIATLAQMGRAAVLVKNRLSKESKTDES